MHRALDSILLIEMIEYLFAKEILEELFKNS